MKKTTGLFLTILILAAIITTLFGCTGSSEVEFSEIDTVTVDEASIEEGFLLSEFSIGKVKLNVQYFPTYENGNEIEGKIIQVPVTMNMVLAEDKAKLRVAGTKTIHIVAFSKYELEFELTLYETETVTYNVRFFDEDGTALSVGSQTGTTQHVAAGQNAIAPSLPTKQGYSFVGWRDRETNAMSTYMNVTKNLDLVAVYEKNEFKVSFYSRVEGKDTLISSANVPREGNALDYAPAIPVVVGYSNGRWENESLMKNITKDVSFYAIYDKDQVNVGFTYKRFSANDETDYVKYDVGSQVLNAPSAEYKGFKFIEWQLNGKKVTFPYTVTSEVVFEAYYIAVADGNSDLRYTHNAQTSGVSVSGYTGKETIIVVPENTRIDSTIYTVTDIDDGVFKDVAVTDYVVSENNRYFITEDNVLFNSSKTVLIAYPSGRAATSYTIPDTVQTIAPYAFYGAKNLTSVVLGAAVTTIGDYAFSECTSLTSFTVNDTVREIGDYAFYMQDGESELTEFTFSAASVLTSIGRYAFAGLNKISEYALPSQLTSIGSGAFAGNKSLRSVSAINNSAFHVYGGALYSEDHRTLYVYPALYDGLETPEVSVHGDCTRIVSGAFSYARITRLIINSVLTLEDRAIDCPTLNYLRLVNAYDMYFNGYISFNYFTPTEIVLPVGASSLYDRMERVFHSKVRYETASESVARSYFYDYMYEQYYYETESGTRNLGVRILGTRASTENLVLPDTLNGTPVTAIGVDAFHGDEVIKTVTLPADLQVIEYRAFLGCTSLETVNFNTETKEIVDAAFADCPKLTTVNYSDDYTCIESFGSYVFDGTPFLEESMDEFITVGNVLVKYNGYKTSVSIPASVTYIGPESFVGNGQITSITFPPLLKKIGRDAFYFCDGLVSLTFPATLREVEDYAFSMCEKLFVATFGVASTDSSLVVNPYAFRNTVTLVYTDSEIYTLTYRIDASESYLEKGIAFTEPYKVENTAKIRFAGWYTVDDNGNRTETLASFPLKLDEDTTLAAKLIDATASSDGLIYRYDEETDSYALKEYIGTDEYVIIPTQYKNRYVRYIDTNAFSNAAYVSNIELPNRRADDGSILSEIEGIGENAFSATDWYRNYAGDFIIIDDYLIRYTGTADTVTIPDGITRLAEGAFRDSTVRVVKFPAGVAAIADYAFYSCAQLEKVVFPESLTSIGKAAFYGCVSLSDINFAVCKKLNDIAYDAFENTAWLTSYPDNCVMINNILYRYVEHFLVKELHVYNGVSTINERAFYGNTYLRSIYIPQSVVLIGASAFEGSNLISVNLFAGGSELATIQECAFKDCTTLTTIDLTLSSALTYIGDSAFEGCFSLREITIPTQVSSTGVGVFAGAGLRTVNFAAGSKLTMLSDQTFLGCTSLFTVNFAGTSALVSIGTEAFRDCTALRDFNNQNSAIESLGDRAFYNCSSLMNFSINASRLKTIGDLALENVGYVSGNDRNMVILGKILIKYNGFETVVEIPSDVTSIYNSAFEGNTRIIEIVFPAKSAIVSVNSRAFYGCTNLASINFPDTIVNVGEDVMTGTEWYESKVRNGEEYIMIANTLIKYNADMLQQAVLPDSVGVINGGAFDGVALYDVLIGEKVYLIKEGAFDGIDTSAYADWTITLKGTEPPTLEMDDFSNLTARYILLPDDATMDGYRLDSTWGELYAKMKVPHKVTVSFSVNESKGEPVADRLTNAIYSEIDVTTKEAEGLTYIFVGWYRDDQFSEKVAYPLIMPDDANVTSMTLYAKFTDNTQGSNASLYEVSGDEIKLYNFETDGQGHIVATDSKIVVISYLGANTDDYMKTIGSGFYLDSEGDYIWDGHDIVFSDHPEDYSDRYSHRGAFEGHTELLEVYFTVNSQIETIGEDAFKNCTNLERIILPSSVKRIAAGAFAGCTSLREIIFPSDGANIVIESNAFAGCVSIKSITLPASVIDIQDEAFKDCTAISDIYLESTVAIVLGDAMPFEIVSGMRIHIPFGSYNSYAATWTEYADYLETAPAPVNNEEE